MTHRSLRRGIAALPLAAVVLAGSLFAAEPAKVIEKGGCRFYVKERRIEIGGKFVLAEGPIELLACAKGGKEYESIISLDVNPEILHFCLLLMKLKPGETGPKFQGDPDNPPTGSPIVVEVRWKEDGDVKQVRAEALCWNAVDRRTMERTPWVFVGSRKQKDPDSGRVVYWANVEKSIITVFRDPYAVMDLPLALGANDDAFVVNKRLVPKPGTACTVVLTPGVIRARRKNATGGHIAHLDVTLGGRVLIDGMQAENLGDALKKISTAVPKDTFRLTVDHGAPAAALAGALKAVAETGVKLESRSMAREQPGVKDVLTVVVSGDKVIAGVKPLTDDELRLVVRRFAEKHKKAGIAVKAKKGASPGAVLRAVRACEGIEGLILRMIWE